MERLKGIIWYVFRFVGNLLGVGSDKVAHFTCCLLVSLFLGFTVGYATGFLGALMLGVGKEYGDHRAVNNRWDWWDIVADTMGALVGMIIVLL